MSKNPEQKAAEEKRKADRKHKPVTQVTRRMGTRLKRCGAKRKRRKNSG